MTTNHPTPRSARIVAGWSRGRPCDRPVRASRGLAIVTALFALVTGACAPPSRTPLPTPFSITRGGTPVPGKGVGLGLELGDGLQGQELLRKELLTGHLIAGIADRVNVGVSVFGGHENDDPEGLLFTGKVRLGAPLGPRTSTALHVGVATVDRVRRSEQDESLWALDFALPTERLLARTSSGETTFGAYVGPRLIYESYSDNVEPADDFEGVLPGALGGLHLQLGSVHLFGEGTVVFRPETTRRGASYGGSAIFLPSGGVVAHLGSPFSWDR